jgi:hypothetical protein
MDEITQSLNEIMQGLNGPVRVWHVLAFWVYFTIWLFLIHRQIGTINELADEACHRLRPFSQLLTSSSNANERRTS